MLNQYQTVTATDTSKIMFLPWLFFIHSCVNFKLADYIFTITSTLHNGFVRNHIGVLCYSIVSNRFVTFEFIFARFYSCYSFGNNLILNVILLRTIININYAKHKIKIIPKKCNVTKLPIHRPTGINIWKFLTLVLILKIYLPLTSTDVNVVLPQHYKNRFCVTQLSTYMLKKIETIFTV